MHDAPHNYPMTTVPLPGWGERFRSHPFVNSAARFAGTTKGKAAIGSALAAAAIGTYYMGRKKRQAEDAAAEEAMAQT
jgi:hypothetical protein